MTADVIDNTSFNTRNVSFLEKPVTHLKGVGNHLATKLLKLGIVNLQDVLFHLPLRYQDRTRLTPIGELQPLKEVVIEATVRGADVVYGKRRSLLCVVEDTTGRVSLRFFHFSNAQKQKLIEGARIRCYGEVRRGAAGLELYHPEYSIISDSASHDLLEKNLTPIYPATEGISQNRLRSIVQQTLALVANAPKQSQYYLPELLTQSLLKELDQVQLIDALLYLHAPPKDAPLDLLLEGHHPYQQRLAVEELLAHHIALLKVRAKAQANRSFPLPKNIKLTNTFLSSLPFALTSAQERVYHDISVDLTLEHPMLRLVQGDVGSGKTIVAALAALQAAANGKQTAIMAPTEILAEQHRINFSAWFEPLNISVAWLTGKQRVAEKREHLENIANGKAQIIIGTHALIQNDVEFQSLGLVIIDEQHRFGVHQRLTLRHKGMDGNNNEVNDKEEKKSEPNIKMAHPHQLIMTATPIPRTLAMSVYADLDCSVIDELPPGRTPVETVAISDKRRPEIVSRISQACGDGRQTYWVCTLIEESETLEAQAAEATAEELSTALPHLNVGLIHGRLKSKEKESIMRQFKSGGIDLLVATTVIEVGVDVPNASLMIIENPERLGLAQLHQLRGRVGRGSVASHCVLLYGSPLGKTAKARLQVMRESSDGFVIAEKDLEIRGPGEVLGTRQTGEMQFKIADLQRDADLLPKIRHIAQQLSPNGDTASALTQRWCGYNERYANA